MVKAKKGFNLFWTVLLSVASVLYVYPILMILLNSFKKETSISTSTAFLPPTADTFAGAANYVNAISSKGFLQSFWYSTLITGTRQVQTFAVFFAPPIRMLPAKSAAAMPIQCTDTGSLREITAVKECACTPLPTHSAASTVKTEKRTASSRLCNSCSITYIGPP